MHLKLIVMMVYFSKNWKQGDPGGTYIASKADESKIIFENDDQFWKK